MSKRQEIEETVLEIEGYHYESVLKFLERIKSAVESIPVEHRPRARVGMGAYNEWDFPEPSFEITYFRPETDEEMRAREAREAEVARERETRDRATYEKLKEKFGE